MSFDRTATEKVKLHSTRGQNNHATIRITRVRVLRRRDYTPAPPVRIVQPPGFLLRQ